MTVKNQDNAQWKELARRQDDDVAEIAVPVAGDSLSVPPSPSASSSTSYWDRDGGER